MGAPDSEEWYLGTRDFHVTRAGLVIAVLFGLLLAVLFMLPNHPREKNSNAKPPRTTVERR